jgi:hypothetical protein
MPVDRRKKLTGWIYAYSAFGDRFNELRGRGSAGSAYSKNPRVISRFSVL